LICIIWSVGHLCPSLFFVDNVNCLVILFTVHFGDILLHVSVITWSLFMCWSGAWFTTYLTIILR